MMDARTTVYKKKDVIYNLKMKASRRKLTSLLPVPLFFAFLRRVTIVRKTTE